MRLHLLMQGAGGAGSCADALLPAGPRPVEEPVRACGAPPVGSTQRRTGGVGQLFRSTETQGPARTCGAGPGGSTCAAGWRCWRGCPACAPRRRRRQCAPPSRGSCWTPTPQGAPWNYFGARVKPVACLRCKPVACPHVQASGARTLLVPVGRALRASFQVQSARPRIDHQPHGSERNPVHVVAGRGALQGAIMRKCTGLRLSYRVRALRLPSLAHTLEPRIHAGAP